MTFQMLFVFGLLTVTIALFVSDRLRLDLVALMALLTLLLSGILTPAEALAGFSDPIVLMIAGLFVVGAGLFQTGVADAVGGQLVRVAGTDERRFIAVIMLVVAVLSAFMSSTGTVAVFLPVVVSLAHRAQISPAKLLIPMAYASLIGGMLTLIGTPPNLVVSTQLANAGFGPFGFFAFAPVGGTMLVLGVLFMLLIGRRLLPDRGRPVAAAGSRGVIPSENLLDLYRLPGSLFRLRIRGSSPLVGQTLAQADLRARYHINVLEIHSVPAGKLLQEPMLTVTPSTTLRADSVLYVKGTAADVEVLAQEQELGIMPASEHEADWLSKEIGVVEVLLTPRSQLVGRTLRGVRFRDTYNVTVLAILRMGQPLEGPTSHAELRFGDTLLVRGTWEQIATISGERNDFVVVGQPPQQTGRRFDARRAPLAIIIMLTMLIVITVELLPTVTAVLVAATAMVLARCLSMEDVYRTMNWESIVLIAGMLPMATALDKTGGIQFIASGLTTSLGTFGPLAVMAGLFVLTSLFSQFLSNTATSVLMAPIALQAAATLVVAPHPMLMAVAVAASTSFSTPIASPVNTLVLGSGGYRFGDFAKVGIPLQIILMLTSLVMLPVLFPW